MTRKQLNVAGRLAILSAVLTVPIAGLSFSLDARSGSGPRALSALLAIANTALFVYLFSTLKALLIKRHSFDETTSLISTLLVFNIAATGLDLLGAIFPPLDSVAGSLLGFAIVPLGLISIAFGIKLLRLRDSLYGMLKPFSYLYMATGLCFATIILMPLGLIGSVVSDVILGIIFFRAAEATATGSK